jgi:hypothetical protein
MQLVKIENCKNAVEGENLCLKTTSIRFYEEER